MTVGLLIITHSRIGNAMVDTAKAMLGTAPMPLQVLPISQDSDPEAQVERAMRLIKTLNQGDGVLVLTDMYGSTPSNISSRLLEEDQVQVVAGINLPMLIRVLNYPHLSLAELVEKALTGGRDGILVCERNIEG